MRSIGARIAVWYALAATLTLACVFLVGYHYLNRNLVHGLDLLNEAEFRQIQSHLGPEFKAMSAPFIELRVREISDNASALFYIEFHPPTGGVLRSFNLNDRDIPELPGRHQFSAPVGDLGEMRIAQLSLPPYRLVIATPLAPVQEVMANYVRVCVALTVGMLLVSLAIGFGLSRLLLRPMRSIRETADRIRSDNLSQRIPVADVRDELSDLARLLNQMFDRLEASFIQIRRFTAEASHELKTPLSLIRLNAEKLMRAPDLPPAHRETALAQIEEIARLNKIVEDLLFLARADARTVELQRRPADPRAFVEDFAADAAALVEHHGMRFVAEHGGAGTFSVDPAWMHQVLLNLLTNAINASPAGGVIRLHSTLDARGWTLQLDDQGPGLPEKERERVFERFVRYERTNRNTEGTGLGLAICRSIVELHGGSIRATAGPGQSGLRIVIALPAVEAARA